jgi:hypothetical protein
MDFFVSQRTNCTELRALNRCRLYLQVIYLSDISSADGRCILDECRLGNRPHNRQSTLKWPIQPKSPATAWKIWTTALAALHIHGRLHKPLMEWIYASHQTWYCYLCPSTQSVFRNVHGKAWTKYPLYSATPPTISEGAKNLGTH